MLNPGGYATLISERSGLAKLGRDFRCEEVPEGLWECDTFTCGHAGPDHIGNEIVYVMPRADPANIGGLCKQCMKLICPRCLGKGCTPLEKSLEKWEARERARQSYV